MLKTIWDKNLEIKKIIFKKLIPKPKLTKEDKKYLKRVWKENKEYEYVKKAREKINSKYLRQYYKEAGIKILEGKTCLKEWK